MPGSTVRTLSKCPMKSWLYSSYIIHYEVSYEVPGSTVLTLYEVSGSTVLTLSMGIVL